MDKSNTAIGYPEAISAVLSRISPMGAETLPIGECTDRVIAEELFALVNSPSVNASQKDGYAVKSEDLQQASPRSTVRLRIVDTAAAGLPAGKGIVGGEAVRILTGARIPDGADAVVAEEYVRVEDREVFVASTAGPGRNVFKRGTDVSLDERLCRRGDRLTPGMLGILAAAGFGDLPVFRNPAVAIISTGDEVVAPGRPLPEGKLYASNMVTLDAWCRRYGMETTLRTVRDDMASLAAYIEAAVETSDAILTSGGAWTGDRDLVAKVLEEMGWKRSFHRIRMGPGKAVGFGMLRKKPVVILPGGPPSNLMAFLQIALPGLLKLGGHAEPRLPTMTAVLSRDIPQEAREWTQFVFGEICSGEGPAIFRPIELRSRLKSMARATAVACVPEGSIMLPKGSMVQAQLLS